MADGPDSNRNGSENGSGPEPQPEVADAPGGDITDLFDGQELGTMLLGQLDDLITSWAKVIEVVAEHGIDPTPLLQSLARTLRATADQLDPVELP
jgi:hypothetical protein